MVKRYNPIDLNTVRLINARWQKMSVIIVASTSKTAVQIPKMHNPETSEFVAETKMLLCVQFACSSCLIPTQVINAANTNSVSCQVIMSLGSYKIIR